MCTRALNELTRSQTGRNMMAAMRPSLCSRRRWCMPVSFRAFLENTVMIAKPAVAMRALSSPTMSKEISVRVATATPSTMGRREQ